MKILIAEDDLTSSLMLKAILKKWGHEIISADDGEKAWALLQQTDAPQLAILDWMMPGIDGVTLCRRLKAKDRTTHIYIILLTSKGDQQHIIEGLEAGADDYIIKPYNNEELRARINVGKRILDLQDRLKEREKLQGVLEMAGAVCHEINQPLQAVSGWSEILLMNADKSSTDITALENIKEGVGRIAELTRKIMKISKYSAKNYMGGKSKIIDIDSSTENK